MATRVSLLARVAGVLLALGAAMVLLEVLVLQCGGDSGGRCALLWGQPAVDELGAPLPSSAPLPASWMAESGDAEQRDVPVADRLHLSLLHGACLAHNESVISWRAGAPGERQEDAAANVPLLIERNDPQLLEKLRACADVDVYIPGSLRGHGYCEDAAAYAKFLAARLLPLWVFESAFFDAELQRNVTYHELCPHTPVLLFNHYWDGVPDAPDFPTAKHVYLMPNIEMFELNQDYYWRVDVVLCKTRDCEQRLRQWYAQEGNPRGTRVFYTRHTTSDVAEFATQALGAAAVTPKDFSAVQFLHTAGSSGWKGTRQVLDCWLARPDLPPLDIFVSKAIYQSRLEPDFGARVHNTSSRVRLSHARLEPLAFGKLVAETGFFLCPSVMEGYGHYLNQARASGGLIVTTDVAPMNELVTADAGVLVAAQRFQNPRMFLSGAFDRGPHGLRGVQGMSAHFSGDDVCRAVDRVLRALDAGARAALAERARRQYHEDTKFFARKMWQLRQFARRRQQLPPARTAFGWGRAFRRRDG
ncbi:hypothetical protein PybrP1_000383 [[Pythium] brassicae (nom. inval.)]|nr:hypothetical protein PybrP1_000383 [[Pythium] brassicae (nom. inval.)]